MIVASACGLGFARDHLTVKANDLTLADYIDPSRRYRKGRIALQVLSPRTVIRFIAIDIQEWPPAAP
jgi:hypothetical protein